MVLKLNVAMQRFKASKKSWLNEKKIMLKSTLNHVLEVRTISPH